VSRHDVSSCAVLAWADVMAADPAASVVVSTETDEAFVAYVFRSYDYSAYCPDCHALVSIVMLGAMAAAVGLL
jgi:hypothetical protein